MYALLGIDKKYNLGDLVNNFVFRRTCDKGAVQSKVLLEMAADEDSDQPTICHFDDIVDRCHPIGKEYIIAATLAATPNADESHEAREHGNTELHQWLKMNADWLFPRAATSYCHTHQKQCVAHPKYKGATLDMMDRDTKMRRSDSGRTDGISQEQSSVDEDPPLYMNIAGVTCVAWSNEGGHANYAHCSEIPHNVWMEERRQWAKNGDEDIFFAECVPRYPVSRVEEELDQHLVLSLVDGPERHGWPCRRPRLLMAGLNRSRLQWVGPEDFESDFRRRFERAVKLDGVAFFQEYSNFCTSRKFRTSPDLMGSLADDTLVPMLFPPGAVARFKAWARRHCALGRDITFADIDHHEIRRARPRLRIGPYC